MARVTVEDCVKVVPNRFDLVILAAQRTRQLFSGAPVKAEGVDDKYPVVALREIADDLVSTEDLTENVIQSHQRRVEMDDVEMEMAEMLTQEQEIGGSSVEEPVVFEDIMAEEAGDVAPADASSETEEVSFEDILEEEQEAEQAEQDEA